MLRAYKFTLALSLALIAFSTAEASSTQLPTSLKATMVKMQARLYDIDELIADPTKNAECAVLAEEFTELVLHAREFTPTNVEKEPVANQPERMELFRKMLEQTAAISQQLVLAFKENDNVKADQILSLLNKQRPKGHTEFRNAQNPASTH